MQHFLTNIEKLNMETENEHIDACDCGVDENDKKCYKKDQCTNIQVVYGLAIIFWFLIIYSLNLYESLSLVETVILIIPIVLFILAMISINNITVRVEATVLKANFFTLGLFVALPLITLIKDDDMSDKAMFIKIAIVSIIFSMLTLVDVWVNHKYYCIQQHIKSIMQTYSIVLLVFAFYRFYGECNFTKIKNLTHKC